eukprot:c32327_g1_i1 orf=39-305(+)
MASTSHGPQVERVAWQLQVSHMQGTGGFQPFRNRSKQQEVDTNNKRSTHVVHAGAESSKKKSQHVYAPEPSAQPQHIVDTKPRNRPTK